MPPRADSFDLAGLQLDAGEARHVALEVPVEPFELGGERYAPVPSPVPVRLRFEIALEGPCMRCLGPAAPRFQADAREVDQPGQGEDLESPYVADQELDLAAWTRDALALALPAQLLCRDDCAGLCPVCGVDLNAAEPGHAHAAEPDPRWAKLRELEL